MNKTFSIVLLCLVLFVGCTSKKQIITKNSDGGFEAYDEKAVLITSDKYEQIFYYDDIYDKNLKRNHLHPFHFHWLHNNYGDLYSIVKKDGKYGIIDDDKNVLVEFIYEDIKKPYNDFLIMKKDGKYGFMNTNFEVVQEAIYLKVLDFDKNNTYVKFNNNKWGCIDDNMDIIIEGKFDKIYPSINGYSRVVLDNKWGFISQDCKEIIEAKYDYVYDFSDNISKIVKEKKVGYINTKDINIIPAKYDYGQN